MEEIDPLIKKVENEIKVTDISLSKKINSH